MNHIDAMKQALDALVVLSYSNSVIDDICIKLRKAVEEAEIQNAIAFEQFEDWMSREMPPMIITSDPKWWARRIFNKFIRLNKVIEEAENVEPVAWYYADGQGITFSTKKPDRELAVPLYTTPPQREWVGLTEDEVTQTAVTNQSSYQFARAIEAKLKEKNP